MGKQTGNNVKLGVFVLAGLIFLVLLLYMIGKNQNLFGPRYELKARFDNIQGLMEGNNVRFSGIEAGTVKKINILSDTVIEVTMMIRDDMKKIIRKNSLVFIGTEGVVGNKVVNIIPARPPGDLAEEGDVLPTRRTVDPDELMQLLDQTSLDISDIIKNLKTSIQKLNNADALWSLLNDESIPDNLRQAVNNARAATKEAGIMVTGLHDFVDEVAQGEGSLGSVLTDTSFSNMLAGSLATIHDVSNKADSAASDLNALVTEISKDVNEGSGIANTILNDSQLVHQINETMLNIREGTEKFNENMEALKHNFLFRGYFRKLEKKRKKELEQSMTGEQDHGKD